MIFKLFAAFFKIGMFMFGGGSAIIPLLQAELVERKKWLSEKEIMDYYSIGQCTPGIIAVNVSTFTGYKLGGIRGSVAATLGIIMPSLIIITLIASLINLFLDNQYVIHAFTGIRVAVAALIADVVLSMGRKNIKDEYQFAIFVVVAALMLTLSLSPVWVICGAGALGLILRRGKTA
jgi:chromate transporter